MQVAPGTLVTIAVGGNKLVVQPIDNFWGSPFDTQIAQALGARLKLQSLTVNGGGAFDVLSTIEGNTYAYTLTAIVASDAYEDPDDMRLAFVAAVYAAAGLEPTSSSVIAIAGTSTGQASQGAPPKLDLTSFFSNLATGINVLPSLTLATLIGAVVLVFIVVSSERKSIVRGLV
jgi:hypothetical protein